MKKQIYPPFYSAITEFWPFPLNISNAFLYYCNFNKENFDDIDYQNANIELPANLNKAINKRKAEYLAGRLCAKEALKKLNYQGYPTTNKDKGPNWPESICGSITHSHNIAAAVVASKQNWQSIGIDIEQLLNTKRSERLLSTVTNNKEQQLILTDTDIGLFTTLAFSIKESLFKALYPITNTRFYFEHAEIIDWSKTGKVRLKLLIELSKEWHEGKEITGQFCIKDNYLWSLITIPNK